MKTEKHGQLTGIPVLAQANAGAPCGSNTGAAKNCLDDSIARSKTTVYTGEN
jgi:hypothetical protein